MNRYLDPKADLAFKRVFGEHAHLLKSFLNALLPLPADGLIESLEYLTSEQVPEVPGLFKNSIVDVKCKDTQGRTFIVEMQMLWSSSFAQRIVFSASQAYVKQLRAGQSYSGLQPVYALAITNQVFDHESDQYYHHYRIVNVEHPQKTVLKGLEFVFIELPKFKPQSTTDKKMQVKWLRFLSEVGDNEQAVAEDLIADEDIRSALELVETGAYTNEELEIYHILQDKARIEPTVISDAMAKGRVAGKAEGEALATSQLILAMHASGMTPEQISQITQIDVTLVPSYLKI